MTLEYTSLPNQTNEDRIFVEASLLIAKVLNDNSIVVLGGGSFLVAKAAGVMIFTWNRSKGGGTLVCNSIECNMVVKIADPEYSQKAADVLRCCRASDHCRNCKYHK